MLKAIEAGATIDADFFKAQQEQKGPRTIKERLLRRLSAGCICALTGLAFEVVGIVVKWNGTMSNDSSVVPMIAGDSQEADDIALDALVRAYVASGSFLGLSKFSTWLFRIAYNCYVDRCRKIKPETIQADTPLVLNIPATDETDAAFRYRQALSNTTCQSDVTTLNPYCNETDRYRVLPQRKQATSEG